VWVIDRMMFPIRDPPTTEDSIGVPVSTFWMRNAVRKFSMGDVIGTVLFMIVFHMYLVLLRIVDPQIVERLIVGRCLWSRQNRQKVLREPRTQR
jgi:hypothetical protein